MSDKKNENQNKTSDDKDFSFMKLIKEIKKESGLNINLAPEFQSEKAPKLKFEPNVNLKRNYVPKPDAEKTESTEQQQNLINLNQISSRFEAKDSLNKKTQQKKGEKKTNLIMLADMLKTETAEKKPKKVRNEDEDIRGIVNNLRAKDHTGYYPTTLPFKLNDVDENNIIKDLINERGALNENNIFLLQFPRVIPYNLEVQEKMKNDELDNEEPTYDANGYLVKAEFQNVFKTIKNNLNIGKIKFYKSGKIKLQIGESQFEVNGGINTKFAQEIALYSGNTNEIVFLGKVNDKKVIVTPDFQ